MLVNLIPYNENGLGLPGASEDELFHALRTEDVHAFQRALWEQGPLHRARDQGRGRALGLRPAGDGSDDGREDGSDDGREDGRVAAQQQQSGGI